MHADARRPLTPHQQSKSAPAAKLSFGPAVEEGGRHGVSLHSDGVLGALKNSRTFVALV